MAASAWRAFPCSRRQLRLDAVLLCGQSFRWYEISTGEWLGVLADRVWRLKQDETHVYFQVYGSSSKGTLSGQNETKVKTEVRIEETDTSEQTFKKHRRATGRKNNGAMGEVSRNRKHSITLNAVEPLKQESSFHFQTQYSSSTKVTLPKQSRTDGVECSDIKVEQKDDDSSHLVAILKDYFQLGVDIDNLYKQWSQADPYFRKVAADFWGIRILRQDPVENLFSFICSSNNHIARISLMVEKLCIQYGEPIAEVEGTVYHSFPTISTLAQEGVEEKLRELGFGYRAKFISTTARYIMDNHSEDWVSSLRQLSYEEARAELLKLCGVGPKVADCVCLMSLDKTGAMPVDTHVWQFAARHYLPTLKSTKSLTDKLYQEIGNHFRDLWGPYAGWAQSVLFTSELRHMQSMKQQLTLAEGASVGASKKRKSKDTEEDVVKAKHSKY